MKCFNDIRDVFSSAFDARVSMLWKLCCSETYQLTGGIVPLNICRTHMDQIVAQALTTYSKIAGMKRVEAMVHTHASGNGKGNGYGLRSDRVVIPERVAVNFSPGTKPAKRAEA